MKTRLIILCLAFLPIILLAQENTPLTCSDGIDNDGDGDIDCMDDDCINLTNNGCDICSDGLSFADVLIEYIPGCTLVDPDPSGAIGANDWSGLFSDEPQFVFLGDNGILKLGFTNNVLTNSGNSQEDLWVFEIGVTEPMKLALRPADVYTDTQLQLSPGINDVNMDGYYEFGAISGSTSGFDIDDFMPGYFAGELKFDAIEITDMTTLGCNGSTPGADIDAVCALSSLEVDCAGTPNGTAIYDNCGNCLEPNDPLFNQSCDECIETPLILTGQNQVGSPDNLWEITDVFSISSNEIPVLALPTPDDLSMVWNPAVVIAPCASTWVDPLTLPSPINQANWIAHPDDQGCLTGTTGYAHYYYRTRFSLPCNCGGDAITADSSYRIAIDLYADNVVLAVYVNGELQDVPALPGGNFMPGGQAQVELNGPWQPNENTITFLVRNNPGGPINPQGFLAALSSDADSDNDGVNDHLDLCMCDGFSIIDTSFAFLNSCNPLDTGIVTNAFLTEYGCDSIVVMETSYLPIDTSFVFTSTCDIGQEGTFCILETTPEGCDSLVCQVINLIPPVDTTFLISTTCDINLAGTFCQVETTSQGCDSIICEVITLIPPIDTTFLVSTTCDINLAGTFCQVETTLEGCDSVVCQVINLIPPVDTTFLISTTCDPVSPGLVCQNLTTVNGCDSTVCNNIVSVASDTTYLIDISCNPSQSDTAYQILSGHLGCDSVIVTFWEFESLDTIFLPDLSGCEGVPVTVFDTEIGVDTFLCTNNVTDLSCDSITCVQVYFSPADTVFLPDINLCEGESAIVFGDVVNTTGQYCEFNTSVLGCDSLTCQEVEVLALPVAEVNLPQSTITIDEQVNLEIDIIQGSIAEIIWFPEVNLDCNNCLSVTASPNETTNYQVTLIDDFSCSITLSVQIEVEDDAERLFIPNAFSPNGDGINDRFTFFANEKIERISTLQIFDRWGSNVFVGNDLEPGNLSTGWDGMHRGKEANPGVYVFFAELLLANGETELVEGEVVLIR